MMADPEDVHACPHCAAPVRVSGRAAPLSRCAACARFYWLEDAQRLGSFPQFEILGDEEGPPEPCRTVPPLVGDSPSLLPRPWVEAPRHRDLTLDELRRALADGVARTAERLRTIRLLIDDPSCRELATSSVGAVARRLLDRAKRQHEEGPPALKRVRSGLPSLDGLVRSWWGLTVLTGPVSSGKTTLAARIALESARIGGRVLWFGLRGDSETPVFRLLTGLARVPARSLFVERHLTGEQWNSLETARSELEPLSIQVVDGHGATPSELAAAIDRALAEGAIDLVVFDGVELANRRFIFGLERLSEERQFAGLAIGTLSGPPLGAWRNDPLTLRPGSLQLHLAPRVGLEGTQEPLDFGAALDVSQAGKATRARLELKYLAASRWLEQA